MQEIIVYRNPAEAAFWDLMSNGFMIPIFAGLLVGLVVLMILTKRSDRVINKMTGGSRLARMRGVIKWYPMATAVAAGWVVGWVLWI